MNKSMIAIAMVGSLAVSLSAFANKGADYKGSSESSSNWSKNWYVGGGINGNASNTQSDNYYDDDEYELDENNVGFDIFVGKNINKHWAAELGFTQVGDVTFISESSSEQYYDAVEIQQWNVHLVGLYKLNVADHFNLFGKFGAAYFNSTENWNGDDDNEDGEYEDETTLGTFAITYGFGAEVTWDRWGVRAEYNVISPAADITSGEFYTDAFYVADIISLNAYYKFGY